MYIPRLRRIPDVVKEMRESDPESVITYALIIGLIKQKKITAMKYGNAWLVNLDELYFYFRGNKKWKTTIYCGLWRTHRESNPELTLRRGLFYPLNYECKLRILRKLVNDMAFSKTLPKTLPIFYSVVKNARYLAFFGLKSPIFAHFCWIHLALRRFGNAQ